MPPSSAGVPRGSAELATARPLVGTAAGQTAHSHHRGVLSQVLRVRPTPREAVDLARSAAGAAKARMSAPWDQPFNSPRSGVNETCRSGARRDGRTAQVVGQVRGGVVEQPAPTPVWLRGADRAARSPVGTAPGRATDSQPGMCWRRAARSGAPSATENARLGQIRPEGTSIGIAGPILFDNTKGGQFVPTTGPATLRFRATERIIRKSNRRAILGNFASTGGQVRLNGRPRPSGHLAKVAANYRRASRWSA